ncbi:uncharacterized protein abi3bpa [Synchiropus picturatus]
MRCGTRQKTLAALVLLLVFIAGMGLCGPSTSQRSRVRRKNMKVRINATGDTIVMKFLRPNSDTKLEGYILGYGSSMFSKQFIQLPENGKPYETEFDAEPKYLIAVQPIPTNDVKKHCKGKVQLDKPLHLVIASVTPTSVLLSWGTLLKTPYEGNIMNDCLEDGHYTVRYRERNRKWNYQTCPTSDTVIDHLKPNTAYEFSVQPNSKDGTGVWSEPVLHVNSNAGMFAAPCGRSPTPKLHFKQKHLSIGSKSHGHILSLLLNPGKGELFRSVAPTHEKVPIAPKHSLSLPLPAPEAPLPVHPKKAQTPTDSLVSPPQPREPYTNLEQPAPNHQQPSIYTPITGPKLLLRKTEASSKVLTHTGIESHANPLTMTTDPSPEQSPSHPVAQIPERPQSQPTSKPVTPSPKQHHLTSTGTIANERQKQTTTKLFSQRPGQPPKYPSPSRKESKLPQKSSEPHKHSLQLHKTSEPRTKPRPKNQTTPFVAPKLQQNVSLKKAQTNPPLKNKTQFTETKTGRVLETLQPNSQHGPQTKAGEPKTHSTLRTQSQTKPPSEVQNQQHYQPDDQALDFDQPEPKPSLGFSIPRPKVQSKTHQPTLKLNAEPRTRQPTPRSDTEPRTRQQTPRPETEPRTRQQTPRLDTEPRTRQQTPRSDTEPRTRQQTPRSDTEPRTRQQTPRSDTEPRTRQQTLRLDTEPRTRQQTPRPDTEPRTRQQTPRSDTEPRTRQQTPRSDTEPRTRQQTPWLDTEPRTRQQTPRLDTEPRTRQQTPRSDTEPRTRQQTPRLDTEPKRLQPTPRLDTEPRTCQQTPRLDTEPRTRQQTPRSDTEPRTSQQTLRLDTEPWRHQPTPSSGTEPMRLQQTPRSDTEPRTRQQTPRSDTEPRTRQQTPRLDTEPRTRQQTPRSDTEPRTRQQTPRSDTEPRTRQQTPKLGTEPRRHQPTPKLGTEPRRHQPTPRFNAEPKTDQPTPILDTEPRRHQPTTRLDTESMRHQQTSRLDTEPKTNQQTPRLYTEPRTHEQSPRLYTEPRTHEQSPRLDAEPRTHEQSPRLDAEPRTRQQTPRLYTEPKITQQTPSLNVEPKNEQPNKEPKTKVQQLSHVPPTTQPSIVQMLNTEVPPMSLPASNYQPQPGIQIQLPTESDPTKTLPSVPTAPSPAEGGKPLPQPALATETPASYHHGTGPSVVEDARSSTSSAANPAGRNATLFRNRVPPDSTRNGGRSIPPSKTLTPSPSSNTPKAGGAQHRGIARPKPVVWSKDQLVLHSSVPVKPVKRPNLVGIPNEHDKPMDLKQGDKMSFSKPLVPRQQTTTPALKSLKMDLKKADKAAILKPQPPLPKRQMTNATPAVNRFSDITFNATRFDKNENSSIFSPQPTSEVDATGKKRFTASHVVYKTDKKPNEPCSITSSLAYFPDEEGVDRNVTNPPSVPPSNLTVVTVEGCPSFVILDWEKSDNETKEYEVVSTTKGPNGQEVSILTTNQTHTAVENLKPESSYEFKVTPKNELGTGPSSDPVSFSTESADPRVSENVSGKDAIWTQFPFKADSYSECNGKMYVKRTWYRKFVGIQLCNSLRYKIYLSDSLNGKFYNIGDQTGYGEDHCQFVDSFLDGRTGTQMFADQLPSRPGTSPSHNAFILPTLILDFVCSGFYRALRQEPVHFGEIGAKTHVTYVGWYECGTPIPGKW